MQVCTLLQTDNHASTSTLSFFTGQMPFLPAAQPTVSKHWRQSGLYTTAPILTSRCSAFYGSWKRGTAHYCCCGTIVAGSRPYSNQSYLLPARRVDSSKPVTHGCSGGKVQTDRWTIYHFIDPDPHTMWPVSITTIYTNIQYCSFWYRCKGSSVSSVTSPVAYEERLSTGRLMDRKDSQTVQKCAATSAQRFSSGISAGRKQQGNQRTRNMVPTHLDEKIQEFSRPILKFSARFRSQFATHQTHLVSKHRYQIWLNATTVGCKYAWYYVFHVPISTTTTPVQRPFVRTIRVSHYQKGNQSGFYWSKRQWVAVASAGTYASLHLAPDR